MATATDLSNSSSSDKYSTEGEPLARTVLMPSPELHACLTSALLTCSLENRGLKHTLQLKNISWRNLNLITHGQASHFMTMIYATCASILP